VYTEGRVLSPALLSAGAGLEAVLLHQAIEGVAAREAEFDPGAGDVAALFFEAGAELLEGWLFSAIARRDSTRVELLSDVGSERDEAPRAARDGAPEQRVELADVVREAVAE
jgi:hypothetical protein